MSTTTTTGISLDGWHTASAVTYAEINRAMAMNATWPQTFEQQDVPSGNAIDGDFGTWSITTGGSGPRIAMALAVKGGRVHIAGIEQRLSPFTMTIEVGAGFIPQPGTSIVSAVLQAGQEVQVTTTAAELMATGLSYAQASGFLSLMNSWLQANLGSFNTIFASIDLDAQYVKAGMEWLRPSWYSYAVAEPAAGATLDNCIFGVLCLIDGAQPDSGLVQQIAISAIPAGQKAAFLVAPGKFLQHMMLNLLPLMFKDIQLLLASMFFTVQGDGLSIRNKSELQMLEVTLENGRKVTPRIGPADFEIAISGSEIVLTMQDMEFEWTTGINVSMTYSGHSTLGWDSANNIMALTVVSQQGRASASMAKWLIGLNVVMGLVTLLTACLGAVGTAISGGAAKTLEEGATIAEEGEGATIELPDLVNNDPVTPAQAQSSYGPALMGLIKAGSTAEDIGALITRANGLMYTSLVVGIVSATATTVIPILPEIAEGRYDNTPKVTDLASAAVGSTVIWPSSVDGYRLQSAALNGVLQLGLS
jgi:hypothetical protein